VSLTARRPRFGLPAAVLRHGVVLVLAMAAIWVLGVTLDRPASEQPVLWLAVATGLGVVTAIIARGLMGAIFLVVGMILGFDLLLANEFGTTSDAFAALKQDGWLYVALTLAALEAYLIALLIVIRIRRA
jgi:hypothetical protein